MTRPKSFETLIGDPISEPTRRFRKTLLGYSVLGIILCVTNLLPKKIPSLDIELQPEHQNLFLWFLFFAILYYLFLFSLHSFLNLTDWRKRLSSDLDDEGNVGLRNKAHEYALRKINQDPVIEREVMIKKEEEEYIKRSKNQYKVKYTFISEALPWTRFFLEIIVPFFLGLISCLMLFFKCL